jgi:hypothetical protein
VAVNVFRMNLKFINMIFRLAATALVFLLGITSFVESRISYIEAKDPALAYRYAPDRPRAAALYADQLHFESGGKMGEWAKIARQSLVAEALNPRAIRLIQANLDLSGARRSKPSLLDLSEKLTRRDLGTQLALIETAAKGNDLASVLRHYDIALTTDDNMGTVLFPLLASAASDRSVLAGLASLLQHDRPWKWAFLNYAAFRPESFDATVLLLEMIGPLPSNDQVHTLEGHLLKALIDARRFTEARAFYLKLPGAPLSLLESVALESSLGKENFRPIAWDVETASAVDAQIDGALGGRIAPELNIRASFGPTSIVAHKLVYLRPGIYRLAMETRFSGFENGGLANWNISCVAHDGAQSIGGITKGDGADKWIMQSTEFQVSDRCEAVNVSLLINAGDSQRDSIASFRRLSVGRR